jgi:hypothetical protein
MSEIRYNTRNEAIEFARRTKVNLENVAIRVEDKPGKGAEPNWRVEISGTALRDFCMRFADLVDQIVG